VSRSRKFVKPLVAAVGLTGTIVSVWWFALKPRRKRARQRSAGSSD
jgi:cbb3-type cytochrome oxidase subunit 3